mmetsp:Transcript_41329/g.56120  ORF Transcript_41329/g.56120 Transcript_41329/m.56120 type:complete len:209 (-) Transcript_41329:29-655(-)
MLSVSFCVSALGSTDNCLLSTSARDPQETIRLERWVTAESRATSSTESVFAVVAVRDLSRRVASMVSPSTRVSESSRLLELTEKLPKSVSEESAPTSESSTLTGLVRTLPTNSSRSFLSTLPTRQSEETPVSTGSALASTSTERTVVLPPLARSPEVSEERVTSLPTEDLPSDLPGRTETLRSCGDTESTEHHLVLCILNNRPTNILI